MGKVKNIKQQLLDIFDEVVTDSSIITRIQYNKVWKDLRVTFKNGKSYPFAGVDNKTFHLFITSKSKGAFFNQNIRHKFTVK